jgi:MFS family permease
VFLFNSFLCFAATIWAARAFSFNSLVASRIVAAFAAAAGEGVAAAISADIFFLHERGWWMGVYHVFLAIGPTLGTLCSGFIIGDLGWCWHCWVKLQ